jgi:superfamily II helicase
VLEVDALEAGLLTTRDETTAFRVLVTTPEKLDLLLRGGWEQTIGRPLTLVVVDEAHNIGHGERGIKLELLLATINRECRNAQFLLLTPFIPNAGEVAKWLGSSPRRSRSRAPTEGTLMADVVIQLTEDELREMVQALDHRGASSGKTKVLRAYVDMVRARVGDGFAAGTHRRPEVRVRGHPRRVN